MTGRMQGRVAVVTAAGQGIGRAIAEAYIREGAIVWATDLDLAKLDGIGAAGTRALDARSTPAVEALAKETGPIDVLVNAAGFVHHGNALDTSEADWDFSFDLNVKSMHRTIHAFLPGMLERGAAGPSASIVNIASGASSVKAALNRYAYGATKAAVIGLTKSVALDFIRRGVRANAICPGTIQSPSLDGRISDLAKTTGGGLDAARQSFVDRQPMGRLGTVEEVAAMAVYLGASESGFTTGQTFLVDGGWAL